LAKKRPKGFRSVSSKNHKIKNNEGLLGDLREVERGRWVKVCNDGYDNQNRKISIHFFRSQSGKVFDVKTYPKWSNNK
jgi:filamentous hemagglutinin